MNGGRYEIKITQVQVHIECVKIFYRVRNETTFITTNYDMELQYRILNRLLDATI